MNNIITAGIDVPAAAAGQEAASVPAVRPRRACFPTDKKEYIDVHINPRSDIQKSKQILLSHIPLYQTLAGAPDGVYLWMYTDEWFGFNKVYSQLEFGTLHDNLAERLGAKVVYLAGEIKKVSGARGVTTYTYNVLSGSYTRHLVARCVSSGAACEDASKELLRRSLLLLDNVVDGQLEYTSDSLIGLATTPITREELDIYLDAGYDVYYFTMKKLCDAARRSGNYGAAAHVERGRPTLRNGD
jgi:hypothetical protein